MKTILTYLLKQKPNIDRSEITPCKVKKVGELSGSFNERVALQFEHERGLKER